VCGSGVATHVRGYPHTCTPNPHTSAHLPPTHARCASLHLHSHSAHAHMYSHPHPHTLHICIATRHPKVRGCACVGWLCRCAACVGRGGGGNAGARMCRWVWYAMNLLDKRYTRVMMPLLGLIKHVVHTVRLRLLCVIVSADSKMNEVDADTNSAHLHKWLLDQHTERSCMEKRCD
jgi:hypothetical protein